jgi:hypothetical protein
MASYQEVVARSLAARRRVASRSVVDAESRSLEQVWRAMESTARELRATLELKEITDGVHVVGDDDARSDALRTYVLIGTSRFSNHDIPPLTGAELSIKLRVAAEEDLRTQLATPGVSHTHVVRFCAIQVHFEPKINGHRLRLTLFVPSEKNRPPTTPRKVGVQVASPPRLSGKRKRQPPTEEESEAATAADESEAPDFDAGAHKRARADDIVSFYTARPELARLLGIA